MGETATVQAIRHSAAGEKSETIKPMTGGKSGRFRVALEKGIVQLDVNRPSETKLDLAVSEVGSSSEPYILHYYGDRGTVMLNSEGEGSLMRGGSKIRVGRSHGYGMFAASDIEAGEIVEEAPTLSQATPFLYDYTFAADGKHILPLGNISLYNHSEQPTCNHSIDEKGEVMTLVASRPIKMGEQLTINYGPMYFAARGYKPQGV